MSAAVQTQHQNDASGDGLTPAAGRQFFELECTYHVGPAAKVDGLTADAHALVSSALGVLLLMELTTDAEFALLHLLRQAAGLLSLAHTMHEQQQFAARSNGGAA